MIYQSQFSDYNDQLYSVELETPPTGSETQWFTIFDDEINITDQKGWSSWADYSNYSVGQTDYGFNNEGFYIWHNPYISRTLPDNYVWFNIAPGIINGIQKGDVIEIHFKFKGFQQEDRNNSTKSSYGVWFGHITASNNIETATFDTDDHIELTTFSTDASTHTTGEDYVYTYQCNGTSLSGIDYDYFGFITRDCNVNCIKFSDMYILNKTNGERINVTNGTFGWILGDAYPSSAFMGDLHVSNQVFNQDDEIEITTTNQANVSQKTYYRRNWNNGGTSLFGSGKYCEIWTNSDSGNFYTFDNCEYQTNTKVKYPDFHMYKAVSLRKGYMYNVKVIYKSKQGAGCNIYLMRNGNVVASEPLHKTSGDDSALVLFQTTLTDDVDEIRVGSVGGNYQRDFYVYRVLCERLEIKQTRVDVTLGGEPFTVELQGDDEDLFKPIRTSIATATIVSEDYLFNLYSNQNDINVRLIKGDYDGDIEWMGVVKPLVFDMGYNQELEEIQIECADYISSLESIYLTDLDIITNHPIMSFGELFNKILFENTKYKNLYVPDLVNFDMLSTYQISTRNFIDDDCKIVTENNQTTLLYADKNWSLYKILEEMCKYMGFTLIVEGEDVILIPYLQLQFTYTYKQYEIGVNLTLVDDDVTIQHLKSVVNLYDNSDLSLLPVLNKFSVKTKTNKVKEIIPDFLDDDNVENITNVPVGQQTTWETSIDLGEYEFDDKTYQCDVKMLKTKSDKCTNYIYHQDHINTQNVTYPNSSTDYNTNYIHTYNTYPVRYSGLIDSYGCGIIDFRAIEQKEDADSNLKSNSMTAYERYLVFSKGNDINLNMLGSHLPMFKIVSDEMQFTNKMALQISVSMMQTPYERNGSTGSLKNTYDKVPIERDEDMHLEVDSDLLSGKSQGYYQTNQLCHFTMIIKIGDYYFHNIGSKWNENGSFIGYNEFFRNGWWTSGDMDEYIYSGLGSTRLQFDNESNTYAFGKSMSETDNSGDNSINQENGGYWVMFNANEHQQEGSSSHDTDHINLPEKFSGKLEIIFMPNTLVCTEDNRDTFGVDTTFLKDFKVKLVVPRNMEYTEDEWNSETQIDAVIDSESLRKAQTIEVEMHTDFGKCPSYSVVMGAHDYQIINMNEGSHCAEEWIVYNYTNQYSDVRKVLDTSVNGEIHPYSLITMTGRNHFGKMVVDSYKKDYRTGYTKVKLIEICNLQEQI